VSVTGVSVVMCTITGMSLCARSASLLVTAAYDKSLWRTVSSALNLTSQLIHTLVAVIWILVSAGSVRTVCEVDRLLPPPILSLEAALRPLHITSSYGLFRVMTGVDRSLDVALASSQYGGLPPSVVARPELVLEGYDEDTGNWTEIEFRDKPTSLFRPPRFVAPHQPRLDWQLWFAALSSYHREEWLVHLLLLLLRGQATEVLRLLDYDRYAFKESPPKRVRVWLYDYDFTRYNTSWNRLNPTSVFVVSASMRNGSAVVGTGARRKRKGVATRQEGVAGVGQWWARRNRREYLPELDETNPSLQAFLRSKGIEPRDYVTLDDQISSCEGGAGATTPPSRWPLLARLQDAAYRYLFCNSMRAYPYADTICTSIAIAVLTYYGLYLYPFHNLLAGTRKHKILK